MTLEQCNTFHAHYIHRYWTVTTVHTESCFGHTCIHTCMHLLASIGWGHLDQLYLLGYCWEIMTGDWSCILPLRSPARNHNTDSLIRYTHKRIRPMTPTWDRKRELATQTERRPITLNQWPGLFNSVNKIDKGIKATLEDHSGQHTIKLLWFVEPWWSCSVKSPPSREAVLAFNRMSTLPLGF